jgi:hypothetical protein
LIKASVLWILGGFVAVAVFVVMLLWLVWSKSDTGYIIQFAIPKNFSGVIEVSIPRTITPQTASRPPRAQKVVVQTALSNAHVTPTLTGTWSGGQLLDLWLEIEAIEPDGIRITQAVPHDQSNVPTARYLWLMETSFAPGGRFQCYVGTESEYSRHVGNAR